MPDRGVLAPPLAVGDYPLARAVGEGDHKLREQFGGGAVVRAGPLGVEPREAGVPAIGEQRPEDVLAVPQQSGHVVCLIRDSLGVVGPARGEDGVADPGAVQPGLVQAERSGVQPRRRHRTRRGIQDERASQVRRRRHGLRHRVRRARRRADVLPIRPSPIQKACRPPFGPIRPRTRRDRSSLTPTRSRPRSAPSTGTGRQPPAQDLRSRCRWRRMSQPGRCPTPGRRPALERQRG